MIDLTQENNIMTAEGAPEPETVVETPTPELTETPAVPNVPTLQTEEEKITSGPATVTATLTTVTLPATDEPIEPYHVDSVKGIAAANPNIKKTFLGLALQDIERAYHWLIEELHNYREKENEENAE